MSHTALQPEIQDIQERLKRVASENFRKQFSNHSPQDWMD